MKKALTKVISIIIAQILFIRGLSMNNHIPIEINWLFSEE